MPRKCVDLTGMEFNGMKVLYFSGKQTYRRWKVQCHCGKLFESRTDHLTGGSRKSCGCVLKSRSGLSRKKRIEYMAWAAMRRRCCNPKIKNYADYGGRGITVCERWMSSFENFLADMGDRPSDEYSLDRIENNLGYFPENCQWRKMIAQQNNKRNNVYATLNGKSQTLKQWSRELHISYNLILRRFKAGWSDEKLLTKPSQNIGSWIVNRNQKGQITARWATYPFSI